MAFFAEACRRKDSRFSGTLSSAQSAVAQGNSLYVFALTNTQSAQSVVAQGNLLYIFARANTQSGADGHVSGTVDYDIFGKPVTETGVFAGSSGGSGGVSALVFAYAGKPYDPVTGLSDYGFRDYAPTLARFTTVDPIRDGSNWYAYCNSDPVNYVDMWGLCTSDNRNSFSHSSGNIGKDSVVQAETLSGNLYPSANYQRNTMNQTKEQKALWGEIGYNEDQGETSYYIQGGLYSLSSELNNSTRNHNILAQAQLDVLNTDFYTSATQGGVGIGYTVNGVAVSGKIGFQSDNVSLAIGGSAGLTAGGEFKIDLDNGIFVMDLSFILGVRIEIDWKGRTE